MNRKKVLVVDAQGGGIGKLIIQQLKKENLNIEIIGIGTNSLATKNMLVAGADEAATGENAIKVASKKADFIIGPVGIVVADSLMGEITPKIAKFLGKSSAQRILIPFKTCNNTIVGIKNISMNALVNEIIDELKLRIN